METLPISKVLREAIKTLPGPDASLRQLIEFCGNHDPTTEFRERWGSDFQIKARDLWADSTDAFKNQRFSSADADELLLCMAYNVAVSPYLSIPEATSHAYLPFENFGKSSLWSLSHRPAKPRLAGHKLHGPTFADGQDRLSSNQGSSNNRCTGQRSARN